VQTKRTEVGNLHQLEIFDCPVSVLTGLAREVSVDVTIENISPVRVVDRWFDLKMEIPPGGSLSDFPVRNLTFDVFLKNSEFVGLESLWDSNGVYALFTERSPIAFKASGLEMAARHKALENFGFILEFTLAGPSSAGWSQIVTPQSSLLDLAEKLLNEI